MLNLLHAARPRQVIVECAGRDWVLGAQNAADWIGGIGLDFEGLSGVMPAMIPDADLADMRAASKRYPDIQDRWLASARIAVGVASGRDWWWTVNMTRHVLKGWPYINGLLILGGVRADQLPFADWLDATYMMLWQRMDEKGRIGFDVELERPPRGTKIGTKATKASLAAFAAD